MLSLQTFEGRLQQRGQLCFVHIPKTAGSTFVEYFRMHAPQDATFWYSPEQREKFHASSKLDAKRATRICGGHFPAHDFLERCGENAVLLSFVRHPVDRIVSYYLFARRSAARHETATAAKELELFDFLQYLGAQRPRILCNQQCRFLAASADLTQEIDIRFEDVQAGWKDVALFLARSSACKAVTRKVAAVMPAPRRGIIQNRKVTRQRPGDVLDERATDCILETNAEDLKLFNMSGIYAPASA